MSAPGPAVTRTAIDGLLVVALDVRFDTRGWFKENWQRRRMGEAGLPDFDPVQHNVSTSTVAGTTRGVHAEPWDKLVSVVAGRVFAAWVDLRSGPGFGRVVTLELGPETAVFVPRGVGNAFQTLVDGTVYSYLVNAHWSPDAVARYTYVHPGDETLAIPWPVALDRAELSAADRAHPRLADVVPLRPPPALVVGAGGRLGQALLAAWPEAVGVGRAELDLTDPASVARFDFSPYAVVVNTAGYTAVDAAETAAGRRAAWAVNASGVAGLVRALQGLPARLVHVSSDYVYDGTRAEHDEEEPVAPLGVYGQTKAAGDAAVATRARHYVLRTSWLVGPGHNFVTVMADLADCGASPQVVHDQHGRLTFADELVRALDHLLVVDAPAGVYHVSNGGDPTTWVGVARAIFAARGRDPGDVVAVSTEQYAAGRALAPRPRHSTLALDRLRATGFIPRPAGDRLAAYLASLR